MALVYTGQKWVLICGSFVVAWASEAVGKYLKVGEALSVNIPSHRYLSAHIWHLY